MRIITANLGTASFVPAKGTFNLFNPESWVAPTVKTKFRVSMQDPEIHEMRNSFERFQADIYLLSEVHDKTSAQFIVGDDYDVVGDDNQQLGEFVAVRRTTGYRILCHAATRGGRNGDTGFVTAYTSNDAGRYLTLTSVHLDPLSNDPLGTYRAAQIEQLQHLVRTTKTAVIIGGDFNQENVGLPLNVFDPVSYPMLGRIDKVYTSHPRAGNPAVLDITPDTAFCDHKAIEVTLIL
jgi:hypothetical protein